jgi:hypothetical protein
MRNGGDRLRVLNLPQLVNVELDASGGPRAVRRSGGQETYTEVETVLECWRIDDEWWRKQIARRYFEVVLCSGRRVIVFNDVITGEWWMQNP